MIKFFKFFFSFKGRMTRRDFLLGNLVTAPILIFLMTSLLTGIGYNYVLSPLIRYIVPIAIICRISIFTMSYRRLQDFNIHGLYWLLSLIGFISLPVRFFLMVFPIFLLLKKGTEGPNKFGPDPLAPSEEELLNQDLI